MSNKILKVVGASWMQTKISSYILGGLGVLAILALFVGQIERIQEDGNYAATVFYSEKTGYRIEYWGQSNELADIPRGVARAYFRADVDTSGWSLLEVETDGSYPDEIQAYAAGIVEGALTWYLIHTHLKNTIQAKCEGTPLEKQCGKLDDALDVSVNIWKTKAAELGNTDPFWHHVNLHYTQIGGVFTGWKHGVERSMNEYETDISDLYWLNSWAEESEIQKKLNVSLGHEAFEKLPGLSSAFLNIVNETADDGNVIKKLYLAHNSAGSYSSMTRILKRYKFHYHLTPKDPRPAPGFTVDFSSYPGSITSQDDFYIIKGEDTHMAVTGTALRNYNNKLWKEVNINQQVPIGPRITAANHLATNVSNWGHILATNNSGTACKQWLVVDFQRFNQLRDVIKDVNNVKGEQEEIVKEITVDNDIRHTVVHRSRQPNGLVWLIEQVPGLTHARDLTSAFLEQGYWATFGLPFIKDIAEITHTTKMREIHGDIFSEIDSPRAVIFKRGFKNVTSLDSIIKLMRQNNLSAVDSANETCVDGIECIMKERGYWGSLGVRGDLVQQYREPYGVIDTKIVSVTTENITSLEFIAVGAPPFTEIKSKNSTKTPRNKGNMATTYTDRYNHESTLDGLEIKDLVQESELNQNAIKPFQWSASGFSNITRTGLPDTWDFGPYIPKWSW